MRLFAVLLLVFLIVAGVFGQEAAKPDEGKHEGKKGVGTEHHHKKGEGHQGGYKGGQEHHHHKTTPQA
ncbi:hypothetical protein QR680_016338 [Steinernema hermaphroditum]|uniref:Uncharacterized protein n=1 Tax=Steinernema hermaphroditum TaxID=289476 RepID=A0AA39HC12_9BILA|nr:hypothetical protein QR680_016338 [Steinernema hermaphroditum]